MKNTNPLPTNEIDRILLVLGELIKHQTGECLRASDKVVFDVVSTREIDVSINGGQATTYYGD